MICTTSWRSMPCSTADSIGPRACEARESFLPSQKNQAPVYTFTSVGALRLVSPMPFETTLPSVKESSGLWHVAQEISPFWENLGSKKNCFPRMAAWRCHGCGGGGGARRIAKSFCLIVALTAIVLLSFSEQRQPQKKKGVIRANAVLANAIMP